MGQFSWLDCKTGEQIIDGRKRKSYVLVPWQFGGGHIEETCYEGYGVFGGHDIYDLVAEWNREYIRFDELREKDWLACRFGGEEDARLFLSVYSGHGVDDTVFDKRLGNDWKRTIGIAIACNDEDNARLRFPIKITHDPRAVYEWCAPSKSDPNQGWA